MMLFYLGLVGVLCGIAIILISKMNDKLGLFAAGIITCGFSVALIIAAWMSNN